MMINELETPRKDLFNVFPNILVPNPINFMEITLFKDPFSIIWFFCVLVTD